MTIIQMHWYYKAPSSPLPPHHGNIMKLPLTVQLGSAAIAADVFELFADLAVDHERHVVVVVHGGLMRVVFPGATAAAAAGLHPGQAKSSPLPRLLLRWSVLQ